MLQKDEKGRFKELLMEKCLTGIMLDTKNSPAFWHMLKQKVNI